LFENLGVECHIVLLLILLPFASTYKIDNAYD